MTMNLGHLSKVMVTILKKVSDEGQGHTLNKGQGHW